MRILTIRQPWAHLIIHGTKNIENRNWRTKYRGPVLIHAGLSIDRNACEEYGLSPADLKTGGVIGMAEIADCVDRHHSKWFVGKYGFVLRKRRALPFMKWTGGLGLRKAEPRLLRKLNLA